MYSDLATAFTGEEFLSGFLARVSNIKAPHTVSKIYHVNSSVCDAGQTPGMAAILQLSRPVKETQQVETAVLHICVSASRNGEFRGDLTPITKLTSVQ